MIDAMSLPDDVVREILQRLPSSAVLRSRAVCKAWHRITTDPSFLAAHAERQPAELLAVSAEGSLLETIPLSLQVDDPRRHRRQLHPPKYCVVRYMLGSCDGLLLFHESPLRTCSCNFYVCNPVTRQGVWLDLVPPSCRGHNVRMCGFYRHGPSGEHRLLVLANEGHTGPAAHYVFSATAASEPPRRLGPVTDGVVLQPFTIVNILHLHHRGKLHWTMHPVAKSADKILSFNTVSEAFRLIARPPWPYYVPEFTCLVELNGMLAAMRRPNEACSGSMELWVLEDYENDQSWSLRFRMDVPPHMYAGWATGTGVPDVILVGGYSSSFAMMYHLTEKRILKRIEFCNDSMGTSGHFLFKDSLVPYGSLVPY